MSGFKAGTKANRSNKVEEEFEYGGSDEEEEGEDEEEENETDEEDDDDNDVLKEDEEADEEADGYEEEFVGGAKNKKVNDGNDDSDEEEDVVAATSVISSNPLMAPVLDLDDDDDEDEMDESYLQKFNASVNKNYIMDFHPECVISNYDEVVGLTKILRDADNNIIDDLHKTLPYLTKYERARVLGQRAKQINTGAKVFVKVPENVIDGYLIAELELAQKRIPFIIRRPTPGGGCEYWNLRDLELIQF
jgi:DNA-directed RNA polymerase subunit K/omega